MDSGYNEDEENIKSDSDLDDENDDKDESPRYFNKSHLYDKVNSDDKTCVCKLPTYEPIAPEKRKCAEYVECVKLMESAHAHDLLMFLLHVIYREGSFLNKNYIINNLDKLYVLIRVNDGRKHLDLPMVQSWEILSFCIVKKYFDTNQIYYLQSFVERKGYGRKLIEKMETINTNNFYVPINSKDVMDNVGFWIKVLPCWKDYYYRSTQIDKEYGINTNKYDGDDEYVEGRRKYFSAWGYPDKCYNGAIEIIRWRDERRKSSYFGKILPKPIIKIIIDYDNSIDCAMERINAFMYTTFKCKLMNLGFTWDNNEVYDECVVKRIDYLLDEFPFIFWPAPCWQNSYSLKHMLERKRSDNYPSSKISKSLKDLKSGTYCSNGEFIMAALLLKYEITIPKYYSPNVEIRIDLIPSDNISNLIKKVYDNI